MDRRTFLLLVGAAGGLAAGSGRAQVVAKIPRIGVLSPYSESTPQVQIYLDALRQGLHDRGWHEGVNIDIEIRFPGVNPQRQRELAAELKALPVAMILAPGTITIRAARDGAPGLPIVMINAGDPLGAGFARSLARPGGDLTGTSAAGGEILAKQLELLVATVPHLKTASALMNRANPANGFFFDAMATRARELGIRLDRIEVTTASELPEAVARAEGSALVVVGDPMFAQQQAQIIELTQRFHLPAVFNGREWAEAGGLMSYLSPATWHWRAAAGFVDKILKGARPGDLPIEQATKFDLVVNLKVAKALGITVPRSILQRADDLIQ